MIKLKNKIFGTTKEQEVFMADFPMMTNHGTLLSMVLNDLSFLRSSVHTVPFSFL